MKAIAAMSRNGVIGSNGRIPWRLPADFAWFKRCTMGSVVAMGRKTCDSLGKPLPGRRNLVFSKGGPLATSGFEVIADVESFQPAEYGEVWVIGGTQIYAALLPRCSDLFLSVLDAEFEGDAFFPMLGCAFAFAGVVLREEGFAVRHYKNLNAAPRV